MKFIEINKINLNNEVGKALVKVDAIVGICQQRVNEEYENPRYAVLTNSGQTYVVDETEYERIKAKLTK